LPIIVDELFKNHYNKGYSDKQKIRGYWTEENLQKEVDKYQTREELKKNNIYVYKVAYTKKLLDKLFNNHINNGYKELKYNL